MAAWHRSRKADLGLRLMGIMLCALAYLSISHLVALHPNPPPRSAGAAGYWLAAIGFLSAGGGGAMTILGHHLFDEIEVSARWRHSDHASGTERP